MDHIDHMFVALMEELQRRQRNRLLMKVFRDMSNPFNTPDILFQKMFRFTRNLAHEFFLQINVYLDNGVRSTRIPPVIQFFVALHFYSHGNYQKTIGKDRDCSLSQASVSRCIHHVTVAIVENFASQYITFPRTINDTTIVKNGFYERFGFPGIVGVIDCMHIAIFPPPSGGIPPSVVFLNRKGFHSINCQIICDATLKIMGINSRYPGSVHDSAIWQLSDVFAHLRRNYANGDRNSWLLGDSGYPLQPFLLTPLVGAEPETPEGRYTYAHVRARNVIERCIGILKGTFRCLLKDRTLHYKPEFAAQITVACATLHNILRRAGVDIELEAYENDDEDDNGVEFRDLYQEGVNVRNQIVRNYFT